MSAAAHRWGVVERLPAKFDGRRMIYAERVIFRHKTEQAAKQTVAVMFGDFRVRGIYVRRLTPQERNP